MAEPKATQCPVCKKGKRESDKYCSEKCAEQAGKPWLRFGHLYAMFMMDEAYAFLARRNSNKEVLTEDEQSTEDRVADAWGQAADNLTNEECLEMQRFEAAQFDFTLSPEDWRDIANGRDKDS